MSSYEELLRLATKLANENDGYPRWVARNRSVSTAYYALFHAIAEFCGRELVGASTPWEPYRHIYRSLDHGPAKDVFKKVLSDSNFGQQTKEIAGTFIDLQEQRHGADYDPGFRYTKNELSDVLARAARACDLVFKLPTNERRLLASRLIGRTRR